MNRNVRFVVSASVFALLGGGLSAQARAQGVETSEAAEGDRAEIVVTAQKREQRLVDVPISISAIDGEEIIRRGAGAIEDLQYSVPGLSIAQYGPGNQRATIRGVSVYSGLPAVGVYLDELPLNVEIAQYGQDVRLFDMERVEVLRGPQGTLYGQGAMGGTIRYITNDVNLTDVEAFASGEIADVDSGGTDWRTEGMVNMPIVADRIGLRVAGTYQNFGGWIDNPVLGETNVNQGHSYAVRGKLGIDLTDRFKLEVLGQHQDLRIDAQSQSDEDQQVFERVPTLMTSEVSLANATATYDFDFATLLSSTGWIRRRDFSRADLTDAIVPFLEGPPPFGFGYPAGTFQTVTQDAPLATDIFAQEVRLASNGNGPFTWTIGGFYRNARSSANVVAVVTPDILPVELLSATGTYPSNSKSYAVFGEASYRLLPSLTALVGLRYFEDKRIQDAVSVNFGVPAIDKNEATFNSLSPRFNLSWQPTDHINIFANAAKGFRSGGFNLTSLGAGVGPVPAAYDPDTIWTYEVGAKFQSVDRALSAEIGVYRNEWSDVQVATNFPGLPTTFTTNSGEVAGWGVDGAVTWEPVRALALSATASWNNMEYKTASSEHQPGDPADYVPAFTGSASAEYRFDLASLPGFVRIDYQHTDRFQVFLRNFQLAPGYSDAQDILNARVGVSTDRWTASLFVRNLTNDDYITYPAGAAKIYPTRLEPRQIGVSASFKY